MECYSNFSLTDMFWLYLEIYPIINVEYRRKGA